jgi:hypothetical protein
MSRWLRRLRGAFVVGVFWALAWGLVAGGIMEAIVDPNGRIADIWPMVLGIPGFFAGVIFSVVFAIAERNRSFEELSLPRFTALGAASAALLGVPAMTVFGAGALVLVPLTLLGAASAAGSLAIARKAAGPEQLGTGDDEL